MKSSTRHTTTTMGLKIGVSLAASITASPVYAMIDCGPPNQIVGKVFVQAGKDQIISSHIWRNQNGNWYIIHKLLDGTSSYRELQYNIVDVVHSSSKIYSWYGYLNRNPSMLMNGFVTIMNDEWSYDEILSRNNKVIMESVSSCTADSYGIMPVPTPSATGTTETPAPISKTVTFDDLIPATQAQFSVAIIPIGSHGGKAVDVTLGANTKLTMIVDTGADIVSVTESIANQLILNNEAVELEKVDTTLADGSTQTLRTININKLTIGGHTLYNIPATVGSNVSLPLLGIDVLNRFGTFKIETTKNLLILG
jgi:clan AA aspartic protease (TIGR02281 family)